MLPLKLSVLKLRWPGDLQRESPRFARLDSRESIRRKILIFTAFERFARITCLMPQNAIRKKGVSSGTLSSK